MRPCLVRTTFGGTAIGLVINYGQMFLRIGNGLIEQFESLQK